MALFDVFRRRKEGERFAAREKQKTDGTHAVPRRTKETQPEREQFPPASGTGERTQATAADAVFIAPHVTEKAVSRAAEHTYTFIVAPGATKPMIKHAVQGLYSVTVRKVRVLHTPAKWRFSRGRYGRRPGSRKAMVYLKKGETIDVV